jgi:hypothetical protein
MRCSAALSSMLLFFLIKLIVIAFCFMILIVVLKINKCTHAYLLAHVCVIGKKCVHHGTQLLFRQLHLSFSLFQYVKDRVSRMQSENSFSNFAEAKPIFERSSKIACD